jgi:hypothetical protein
LLDFLILSFFVAADFFFYVFEVVAVFLRGERYAVVGVGDGSNAVARDLAMLRIGRRDLQAVEEKAGALGIELIRSQRACKTSMRASWMDAVSSMGGRSRLAASADAVPCVLSCSRWSLPTGKAP